MRKYIPLAILGLSIFIFAVWSWGSVKHPQLQGDQVLPAKHSPSGGAASWAANYDNPRELVGFFQNVFAGKVLKEVERHVGSGIPKIRYDVDVIYNLKGNANTAEVVEFDASAHGSLDIGTTYLFAATHYSDTGPMYFVSFHPAMATVVSKDPNLTDAQLLDLVKRSERTYELLNAYPNEVLFENDVARGHIENSFQSLSNEQKQAVYAKFQELIPPRPVPELLPPPPPPLPNSRENYGSACVDGIDNDGDGLIDKADPDCRGVLTENNYSVCRDNIDDDANGLIDSADPDCAQFYPQPIAPPPPPPPSAPSSTAPVAPPPPPAPVSTTSTATSTDR